MSVRASPTPRLGGIGVWLQPPLPDADVSDLLARGVAAAAAADHSGLGALWVSESDGPAANASSFEAYSLLGALAVATDRIRLGVVTGGDERRAPSILSKIVTGIDVISHGRAILSLDGDGSSATDTERLFEALTVCRSVLEDEIPTYAGRIYSIDGAINRPAPVQAGGVPVAVFLHGGGPARVHLLETAARLADVVIVDGGADGVRQARQVVEERRTAGTSSFRTVDILGTVEHSVDIGSAGQQVARLRSAGATGCLVGVAYPWTSSIPAELASML